MELYVDLLSQPCRSVYMFVKKNNLPVDVKIISLMKGEHHSEQFVKVNPLKKVPGLRDGEFGMGESIPMMQYLAEKFHTPDHWFPKDPKKRARVNEYLSWQHMAMRMSGTKIFWMKLLAPVVFKLEVAEDKLAATLEELKSALDTIENVFIQEGGFIGGDQISVADLVAIVEIVQPISTGLDVFEGRPKLSAWRDRVVQAVGKELYDEAHQALNEVQEKARNIDGSKLKVLQPLARRIIR